MTLAAGARLGPYSIQAPLGAGGMGEVYRAIDTRLDRTVAIKVLSPHVADSPARRQRFEREARAVSSLNHPHICSLYDVGEQDGAPFLVIEYVEGETLAVRVTRGPLPIDQVLQYASEIVDAVDHAHRKGIIHRDLKPANVMLTPAGVKLLDFGVAKLRSPEPGAGGTSAATSLQGMLTEEGTIVGTLHYMAPEQLEARDTDARTDIFALGVVLYEMLTGRPPFDGPSRASVIAAILERDATPPVALRDDAPPRLDQIVTRCLAKDPSDRWQTAADLRQALTAIAHSGAPIQPATPASAARAWRRAPLVMIAVALLAIAALTAIGLGIAASRRAPADTRAVRFVVSPPENASFSQSSAFMAVSPDGHSLAFVASSPGGNNALWVRSLDSLNARQLPGTDGAAQPFWSPDSRFVAFGVVGTTTEKRIDVVNGLPQTIEGAAIGYGTWNDDGVIVQASGQGSGLDGRPLYRVSASGGSPMPATAIDKALGEISHAWPQFLPDGRHFIYLARSGQPDHNGVVYVGSLDSMDRVRILNADSHAMYAPQGYLLFMRANTLVAQAFDASTFRLSGEPIPIAEQVERTAGSYRGAFSISPAGVLAYRSIGETRLAWYDRAGRPLQSIGPPGQYSNPALSPDEQRIAVGRLDFETGVSHIWMIELTRGGLASRFSLQPTTATMPLWSLDGTRIVFRSGRRFHQKAASGGAAEEMLLTDVGVFGSPLDWSHDDDSLLYQADGPNGRLALWTLPLGGDRQPIAVFRSEFQQGQAHFSPDGRWMASVSNESRRNEVFVQAFPSGEGRRQVSTEGGLEPAWRGDGKELFYLALDRHLMSVAVARGTGSTIEPGLPTSLFETRMSALLNPTTRNQYLVSEDGQRFLINQPPAGASSSPITVVVNWTAALKEWSR